MSNQILFKIRKSEHHPIINVPAGENKNIKCMPIDPDREFGCDLILSYEMFKGMNYCFDNISEHGVVRLSFTSDRDTYFTGMRAESSGCLGYFYVFSEE